jgi:hypothetical protein
MLSPKIAGSRTSARAGGNAGASNATVRTNTLVCIFLTCIFQMTSDELLYSHNNFVLEFSRTLSHPYSKIVKILNVDSKPLLVVM